MLDKDEYERLEENRKIYGYILVDKLGQIVYQYDNDDWGGALMETLKAKRKLAQQNVATETIPVGHDENETIKEELDDPFNDSNSFKFNPNIEEYNVI